MTKQGGYPYRIEPPAPGRQANALRIETIEPQPRCRLRPRTAAAAWEVEHRPHHVSLSWASFGYCQGGARSCAECPVMKYSPLSPDYIEEGSQVVTERGERYTVESFETAEGLRTGYVTVRARSRRRLKLDEVRPYREETETGRREDERTTYRAGRDRRRGRNRSRRSSQGSGQQADRRGAGEAGRGRAEGAHGARRSQRQRRGQEGRA